MWTQREGWRAPDPDVYICGSVLHSQCEKRGLWRAPDPHRATQQRQEVSAAHLLTLVSCSMWTQRGLEGPGSGCIYYRSFSHLCDNLLCPRLKVLRGARKTCKNLSHDFSDFEMFHFFAFEILS